VAQGTLSGIAICIHCQELAPSLLPRKATGEPTASQSQSKPITSSIQQLPMDNEAVVEAVAGVAMKPLSSDPDGSSSDIVTERTSDEEDMLLASTSGEAASEVDPSSLVPLEAAAEAEAGTVDGRKWKTEMGPIPPQVSNLLAKQAAHIVFVGPKPAVRITATTVCTEVRAWVLKSNSSTGMRY